MILKPFQLAGSDFLVKRGRAILGDDPGLGKTVQTIHAWDICKPERTLIVVPSAIKLRWRDGFYDQLQYTDINIISGDAAKRKKLVAQGSRVTVISLDNLRTDINLLLQYKYDCLIFDEAHNLKNRQAKMTKAAFTLTIKNAYAKLWMLSGSLILNHGADVWPLLHMVDHHKFRGYWPWVNDNFEVIEKRFNGFPVRTVGKAKNADELSESLRPYILRRTIDNTDLFTHGERLPATVYNVEMHPDQRRVYDRMKRDWIYEHRDSDSATIALNSMGVQMRLQQICTSADLLDKDQKTIIPGAKFDVLDILLQDSNRKFFIVSAFRGTLEAIRQRYGAVTVITGDVPKEEQHRLIKDFQHNDHRVLAGTIRSVREGLDGLQLCCADVIFMDRDWVPAYNDQVIGRVDRFGQSIPVRTHIILCENTVEQRIYRLIEAKRAAGDILPITKFELYQIICE